jgi:hypothetical protein
MENGQLGCYSYWKTQLPIVFKILFEIIYVWKVQQFEWSYLVSW